MTEETYRHVVESWDDVEFVMTGVNEFVDGDGVTMAATQLQPGDNAVLELVVGGETKARVIRE